MDESEDTLWEDRLSRGLIQMTIQDDETGECWPVTLDEASYCLSDKAGKPPSCLGLSKKWKIPREYSLLGCNPSQEKMDVQPLLKATSPEETSTWSCEKDEEADETVVVAKFPPVGKVPLFGRKRCRPFALENKDAEQRSLISDTSTRKKRFLEGRDGILLVGRLILACLILVSPGYFLPLLFSIRVYCHVWKHGDGDQSDDEIIDQNFRVFGFLRPRAFLKYTCRFCRERHQAEKMFRLHNSYGTKCSNNVPIADNDEDSPGCDCHNH